MKSPGAGTARGVQALLGGMTGCFDEGILFRRQVEVNSAVSPAERVLEQCAGLRLP